jgi:hypothetical protein
MDKEQEIKAKALELAIRLVSVFPEADRINQLNQGKPAQVVIDLSLDFQNYLKKH